MNVSFFVDWSTIKVVHPNVCNISKLQSVHNQNLH
jgi:hypothetical protein